LYFDDKFVKVLPFLYLGTNRATCSAMLFGICPTNAANTIKVIYSKKAIRDMAFFDIPKTSTSEYWQLPK